jgi:hypothetical protein
LGELKFEDGKPVHEKATPHEVNWPARWIGDSLTWSIRLPAISGKVKPLVPHMAEMLYSNSWRMSLQGYVPIVKMDFEIETCPWLRYAICDAEPSESGRVRDDFANKYQSAIRKDKR